MNKAEIKQIILEEIKYALKEMGEPDPELYPDGYDFEDEDPAITMAVEARPDEDEDLDMFNGMDEDLYEMARTSNVFKVKDGADLKSILQFMQRVNDVLKKYKSPGQKKPKKRFTPEEMKTLANVMVNPNGFTSKDIIATTSYSSPAQANKFLQALEMKGLITLTSQLKKSMEPTRDPNAPETRGRKKKSIEPTIPTPDDEDFDMGDFEDLDMSPIGEALKKYVKKYIQEAKNPLATKMKEIETQGSIAALETKLNAVAEMIEETNGRLTRIDEDNEFADMMDKNAVKEVRKQLKELEKAQAQLQKEYEKVSGGRKKEKVVGEAEDDDIPENPNDPMDHPALPEEVKLNEGRYGRNSTDNDPRYLYPNLFKDDSPQIDQEWVVTYMNDSVIVMAHNKGAAIKAGADMMGVPGPDEEYMTARLKENTRIDESILRMKKLAGLITESDIKKTLNLNENFNPEPASQGDWDDLNPPEAFGFVAKLYPDRGQEVEAQEVEVLFDTMDDFGSDEEAKAHFNKLFDPSQEDMWYEFVEREAQEVGIRDFEYEFQPVIVR